MTQNTSPEPNPSHFPTHDVPRVWIISAGTSPIGIALARQALAHGDYVVSGLPESSQQEDPRSGDFEAFRAEVFSKDEMGCGKRLRIRHLDIRCGFHQ